MLYPGHARAALPPYPLARRPVPWTAPTAHIARIRALRAGPLNAPQLALSAQTHPGLAQHVIKGEPIMPAAGFIEMVRGSTCQQVTVCTDYIV